MEWMQKTDANHDGMEKKNDIMDPPFHSTLTLIQYNDVRKQRVIIGVTNADRNYNVNDKVQAKILLF